MDNSFATKFAITSKKIYKVDELEEQSVYSFFEHEVSSFSCYNN